MKYDQTAVYTVLASLLVGALSHYNIIVGQSEALNVIVALGVLIGAVNQAVQNRKNAIVGGYHPSLSK
jgi:hypothetical protein